MKILALAGLLSAAPALNAQETQQPAASVVDDTDTAASFLDSSPQALGRVVNMAEDAAQKYIAEKGWQLGANPDGRYVAVGVAGISVAPTDRSFAAMRRNAFQKAMLDAKGSIAKFVASEIKSEITHAYGSGSEIRKRREALAEMEGRKNAGILAKIKLLVSAKLDNALRREGVAIDDPEAERRAGKLLNEDFFSNLVERSATAFTGGLIASKVFEENGKIAVVAYYSDNSRILANAIAGKSLAPRVPPRKNGTLAGWLNSLSEKDLYPSFGVQLASDENGDLVVLAYEQSPAASESPNALRNARTAAEALADGDIRQFAGTLVSYDNVVETLEKTKEFETGIVDTIVEDFQDTKIKSASEKLTISGLQTLRTWHTKDTRSGKIICGVVRAWSFSSYQAAQDAKRSLTLQPAAPNPPAAQPAPDVKKADKYKIQGIESEDF